MNLTKQKTAYISGASRGIGAAIAEKLAKKGYSLALTCEKQTDRLQSLAEKLHNEYGTEVLTFTGDISDYSFLQTVGNAVTERFSHIDAVVNNAGIAHIGLLTDMTVEEWHRILTVNLTSCFYSAKVFVPMMVHEKSGSIINISSMWGQTGASCEVAYSAAKGGMDAFTKALAKELAPSGISVNAISCGVIDTDMNAMLSAEELAALREEIPAGRLGTPSDVADAVAAILDAGNYLTGQIIGVNGGLLT